jgi:hypothetical protein
MGLSIAPGFHKERVQLMRLLNRAADMSRALGIQLNGKPIEAQLKGLVEALQEIEAFHFGES